MIELKGVERTYKAGAEQTWVLRNLKLQIREGDFVTIMGHPAQASRPC